MGHILTLSLWVYKGGLVFVWFYVDETMAEDDLDVYIMVFQVLTLLSLFICVQQLIKD